MQCGWCPKCRPEEYVMLPWSIGTSPCEQVMVCQQAKRCDQSLVPYIDPGSILACFQRAEVVAAHDCLVDQSLWIIEAIHHRALARLQRMVKRDKGYGADIAKDSL